MDHVTELAVETGGERLDRYVSDHLADLSRAAVQRLIDEGHILVDGQARKASYRLVMGELIRIQFPPVAPAAVQGEDIPLDILYEDDDMIVVNKPAGLVVHPAAGHSSGTLVNALVGHTHGLDVGGEVRPGIVHRLDADTSGLILVAKTDRALRFLQSQFKSRQVQKHYLALVEGQLTPPRGRIEAPIGRDPIHRQKMAVLPKGRAREAVTVFRSLENLGGYTLVDAEPKTGRTHQIRVHLAYIGYPVVGDSVYGRRENRLGLSRHFLHAWKISVVTPDGRPMTFTAPLPDDLRKAVAGLGFDERELDSAP